MLVGNELPEAIPRLEVDHTPTPSTVPSNINIDQLDRIWGQASVQVQKIRANNLPDSEEPVPYCLLQYPTNS